MTKLEILQIAFDKNKGHSKRLHRGRSYQETGSVKGCYRCLLLDSIDKVKQVSGQHRGSVCSVPVKEANLSQITN